MKTQSTRPVRPTPRKPKALVFRGILIDHAEADMDSHYVAVPLPSLKAARNFARWANLSEEEKIEVVARYINSQASSPEFQPFFIEHDRMTARALVPIVLKAIGFTAPPVGETNNSKRGKIISP